MCIMCIYIYIYTHTYLPHSTLSANNWEIGRMGMSLYFHQLYIYIYIYTHILVRIVQSKRFL